MMWNDVWPRIKWTYYAKWPDMPRNWIITQPQKSLRNDCGTVVEHELVYFFFKQMLVYKL